MNPFEIQSVVYIRYVSSWTWTKVSPSEQTFLNQNNTLWFHTIVMKFRTKYSLKRNKTFTFWTTLFKSEQYLRVHTIVMKLNKIILKKEQNFYIPNKTLWIHIIVMKLGTKLLKTEQKLCVEIRNITLLKEE